MAIFSRDPSRRSTMTPFKAGLVALVLVVVGTYFAYTQANPFADAFELKAAFNTVNNLQPDSPVRIAGVEVGAVKEVAPMEDGGDGAMVTMEIEDHGLPIHEDAELQVRPRIFLEGNEFVDLSPGTPSAPVADEGYTVPVNQTATPVQLGQVLAVLKSDSREDLRTFLTEYSTNALKGGGARGFRESIQYWEEAYRNSALANEATLGTEEGDLFRVIKGQQQTFDALSREPEDLADLVTNFNTTAAAFASEDAALERTIPALRDVLAVGRPALQSLNSSFPGMQRFAIDALPAVQSSQKTVPESFPFVRQLRLLTQPEELRGLARKLRKTIPPLAVLNKRTVPLLQQSRALSACTDEILVPFANTPLPNGDPGPDPAVGPESADDDTLAQPDFPYDPDSYRNPFAELSPRAFVGLAGESRTSDANNKFFRVNFRLDNATTLFRTGSDTLDGPFIQLGAGTGEEESRPAPPPLEVAGNPAFGHRRPNFRPDFPCELSALPDLRAPSAAQAGQPGPDLTDLIPGLPPLPSSGSNSAKVAAFGDKLGAKLDKLVLQSAGLPIRKSGAALQAEGGSTEEVGP